jgi:hypothetical protein
MSRSPRGRARSLGMIVVRHSDSPTYVIRLRALPGADGIRAIRWLLKLALRRFGLKCIAVRQEAREECGPP